MLDFLLARMKAWAAAASVAVTAALIQTFESSFMFDIPASLEATILAAVAAIFVHQVPNKTV